MGGLSGRRGRGWLLLGRVGVEGLVIYEGKGGGEKEKVKNAGEVFEGQ